MCPPTYTCLSSYLLLSIFPHSYYYVHVLMAKKTKPLHTGGIVERQLGARHGMGGEVTPNTVTRTIRPRKKIECFMCCA